MRIAASRARPFPERCGTSARSPQIPERGTGRREPSGRAVGAAPDIVSSRPMMTTEGTETSQGSFAAKPACGGCAESRTSAAATIS